MSSLQSATITSSRRPTIRTAIQNIHRQWIGSWRCPLASTARKRFYGTTHCAFTPCRPRMKLGFIGVGNIGAQIAGQLLGAGHSLVVHDLRPEAAQALLRAGAIWSNSAAALAEECEVVATCLPGPTEMEQVCLGPSGIVGTIKPGGLYIDHTTNSPLLVRRVHDILAARGVAMLDAPVSGGFERARPLLDAVAKRVLYTGQIGTGSIAKIMHNSASFTLDLVMAECWTTAV